MIKKIVDQDTDSSIMFDKVSEDKLCFMVAQQAVPTQSHVRIVAANPQTNNDSSDFTQDVVRAAQIVVSRNANTALLGIAVDGVSVESRDVMQGNSSFLDGESTFAAAVDNKHNMKNTRYSHHGGSSAPHLGNLMVDSDAYRQSGVNSELWRVKDFTSDAKVMAGCSYPTLKKIADAIKDGRCDTIEDDDGALACALLFMRLHLYAVNWRDVPAKHCAL